MPSNHDIKAAQRGILATAAIVLACSALLLDGDVARGTTVVLAAGLALLAWLLPLLRGSFRLLGVLEGDLRAHAVEEPPRAELPRTAELPTLDATSAPAARRLRGEQTGAGGAGR